MRTELLLAGDGVTSLDDHLSRGGGTALEAARSVDPEVIVDTIAQSGLRGRGGAGFPVGTKWRSIMAGGEAAGERFVVANGAEGEPGTFKDRALIRHDPYSVVEGVLIAMATIGVQRGFIALKASFEPEAERILEAVEAFAAAGLLEEHTGINLVRGPDEYLYGEEKALLEVIEGEEPLPRMFPPYVYGLFSTEPQMGWSAGRSLAGTREGANPTLVNNIESFASVTHIVRNGAEWYRSFGTLESPGTIICTVSGDTVRHGVGEFEMGTPVEEVLVELGGGLLEGRAVKYVLSGVANPVLRGQDIGAPLSHEGMAAAGAGLGTGGLIVYDDRTDPGELAWAISRFLSVESCGQCPPCKLGTMAVTDLLEEIGPSTDDPRFGQLTGRLANTTDASRCFLPAQAQHAVGSLIGDMHDPAMRMPPRGLGITKLVDLVDGRFVLDERQFLKRPDWTYETED